MTGRPEWLAFRDGRWQPDGGPPPPAADPAAIARFAPNLVGYLRVALCLAAGPAIAAGRPVLAAGLVLASVLLDWVDGPLARALDQTSIFGSALDWLADVQAQVVLCAWLGMLSPGALPWLLLATTVELAVATFDVAVTGSGRYPVLGRQRGALVILEWCLPSGRYTWFGTFLWLAYPACILARCLELEAAGPAGGARAALGATHLALLVPAALYVWCELAYLVAIVRRWREPPRAPAAAPAAEPGAGAGPGAVAPFLAEPIYDDGPGGLAVIGRLDAPRRELLERAWRETEAALGEAWPARLAAGETFWVNLWQRSGDEPPLALPSSGAIDGWARAAARAGYPGAGAEIDGYGLVVNPPGSRAQPWHVDYTLDYSTLFVPLTRLDDGNAFQYLVVPRDVPEAARRAALADLDRVDVGALARAAGWLSVRQLLAPPGSVIRMDFGAVHRGVASSSPEPRIVFWVSVKRRGPLLPPEPLAESIRPSG